MDGRHGNGEAAVGIIAGRFVAGAVRVEAASLAGAVGAQAPRGVKELRLSDVDETEVTLGLDATRALLQESGVDPSDLAGIFVASRDADPTGGLLVKAAGLDEVDVQAFAGSREAAAGGLKTALDAAGRAKAPVLFVGAQDTTWIHDLPDSGRRVGSGAGAVALLVGPDAPVVHTSDQILHHVHDIPPVERLVQAAAQEEESQDPRVRTVFAVQDPMQLKRLARSIGSDHVSPYPVERLGDLGAAAPGSALLGALGDCEPGDAVALVVPGDEQFRVLRFKVVEHPRVQGPETALAEPSVDLDGGAAERLHRVWVEHGREEPRGAYVPLPVFHAQDPARLRFVGQQCAGCGRRSFPPRERCPGCGQADLEPHAFSGEGTVYSVTQITTGGAPSEFAPLQGVRGTYGVAVVELKEGPRVAAMLTGPGMDGSGSKIGDPVRLVVRLLYVQDGVPRYSFKASPLKSAATD